MARIDEERYFLLVNKRKGVEIKIVISEEEKINNDRKLIIMRNLDETNKSYMLSVLEKSKGDIQEAAYLLGISYNMFCCRLDCAKERDPDFAERVRKIKK